MMSTVARKPYFKLKPPSNKLQSADAGTSYRLRQAKALKPRNAQKPLSCGFFCFEYATSIVPAACGACLEQAWVFAVSLVEKLPSSHKGPAAAVEGSVL
jgi:hypothetical protein